MACEHSCCPRSPKARELGHPDSCVGRWATCLPEGLEPSFEILKLRKNIESDVLTLGFDFYQASDPKGGPFVVRLGVGANSDTEKVIGILLDHGALQKTAGYTMDAMHHLDVVANNSNAAVTYGGTYTVAPQTYDVWLDGAPALMGKRMEFLANLAGATQFTALSFLTYTSITDHVEILIDDVSVTEGAVVKPPAPKP